MLTLQRGLNLFCVQGIGSTSVANKSTVPRFFIVKNSKQLRDFGATNNNKNEKFYRWPKRNSIK